MMSEVGVETVMKSELPRLTKELASLLHDAWLERNGSWAPAEQNKPYSELSEEEKDRVIIRKGVEIYKKNFGG